MALAMALPALAVPPELETVLKERKEKTSVLSDLDFEGKTFEQLLPKWKIHKGKYEVVDGVLRGQEIEADKHVSTAGMDLAVGKRALIYYEVELHKAGNVIVTINGKGRGHVCRAVITRGFLRVQSDNKGGAVKEERKHKIASDQKLKVLLELNNGTLSARLLNHGNGKALSLTNDFIDHPIDNVRWAVAKGPAKIDNVCVVRLN
jgi:hypothetical protein